MWKVEYTKRFLKELSELPKEIQSQAEDIVFKDLLASNPFSLGYLERMTGYPNRKSGDVGANGTFEYEGWVGRCEMVTSDESGIVSSAEVKSLGFRLAYCYKYLRIKCARFKLACVML
jgi:hypothetical protein